MQIQWLHPEKLTPYANNSKKHPTEQIDQIAQQIHRMGFDQPIVVDRNLVIIKGHGRREAALRLQLQQVPVIVRDDLDDQEAMLARIADNKVAESEWSKEHLRFEFGTLIRAGADLSLTGFVEEEVNHILEEVGNDAEEQREPAVDTAQFIVSTHCKNEPEMQGLFDELRARGFKCNLIT